MFAAKDSLLTRPSAVAGYQISRSLRFNAADNAYLSRTPASSSSKTTWTFSTWFKRSSLNNYQTILSAGQPSSSVYLVALFFADNQLDLAVYGSGGAQEGRVTSTAVYRDLSAWYHVMAVVDTTNATSSNRLKLYINGSQITTLSLASYPAQNSIYAVNSTDPHFMGTYSYGTTLNKIDGYQTETYLIDGQALTPSSFGETDTQTGVWKPKAYSGSYGTNGFYLNFSDNSNTTAATLGKDYSGNGNNWTPNNFSVSSGAGNDSLFDSPTSYGTDTGVGGTVRGNYCTWNPLAKGTDGSGLTLSNGNLDGLTPSNAITGVLGTIGVSSGKFYWEVTPTADGTVAMIGIGLPTANVNSYAGGAGSQSWGYYANGDKFFNDVNTAYGATYTNNDVIGIALDMDAGTVAFYKNGTSQGTAFTGLTGTILPMMGDGGTVAAVAFNGNFGQRPFAYTAPSGFKALCTQNLPTPTIGATTATQAGKFFDTSLYTGNAGALTVTNSGFQPDWLWIKRRDASGPYHNAFDSVRGVNKILFPNVTDAEYTSANYLTSFNSGGFTLGAGDTGTNANGATYVGWQWKANGSGSSNTAGTITSTVSASTTSGFSIVTYTGTGSAATIGHGLGIAPSMLIFKSRSNGAENWNVYHKSIGTSNNILLNTTGAMFNDTAFINNTAPTSSVLSVGGSGATGTNQGSATFVCYAFAPIAGYSAFGSYTGNGSTDGPFVFTGMRPAYVMVKRTDSTSDWYIWDTKRDTYNVVTNTLLADTSGAETSATSIDNLSNGFKCRSATVVNASGGRYIYMAFAEAPQKFSLAR